MKPFLNLIKLNVAFLLGMILLVGCQQEEDITPINPRNTPTVALGNFFGLSPTNEIFKFKLAPAYVDLGAVAIRGLRTGELIISIDVRPVTRVLYGVSNMNKIYTIDRTTGLARPLSRTNFTPAIEGSTVGFDFNLKTGMIMLMTDIGQTLTIHPLTGLVVGKAETNLKGINALANAGLETYSITTTDGFLNGMDSDGNTKVLGPTGLTIVGEGGLDYSRGLTIGVFLASGFVPNISPIQDELTEEAYRLYSIDTQTGQATSLGRVKNMIGVAAQ